MAMRYAANSTGALTLVSAPVAGTTTGGVALSIGDNSRQKIRNLSALVTCLAETSTMTFAAKWQVSNDNSTWVDVTHGTQNATAVVLATGTAGADAAVTRCIEAPQAVYGWKFARIALVNGVVTGTANDTYTLSYNYRVGA